MGSVIIHTHSPIVKSANCQDFAVESGEGNWHHYTGAGAYDQVLSDLYEAGQISAYYETQSYWGEYCEGEPHTCGL